MAEQHGKNCFFAVEDSTGASRNLSADGNSITMTESVNNPESTGFGDSAVERAASGLTDVKFSYEGWANDAANTNLAVLNGLKGLASMVSFAPAGSGAGSSSPTKYSACVLVDDVEVKGGVDSIITARASFSLRSGSLTKGTNWNAGI